MWRASRAVRAGRSEYFVAMPGQDFRSWRAWGMAYGMDWPSDPGVRLSYVPVFASSEDGRRAAKQLSPHVDVGFLCTLRGPGQSWCLNARHPWLLDAPLCWSCRGVPFAWVYAAQPFGRRVLASTV